jgi:transposase
MRALEDSKIFGVFYFLVNIGIQIGLLDVLKKSFPEYWEQIYSLVMFTLNNSEAYDKCHFWLSNNVAFDNIGEMRSQNISNLLYAIKENERNNFYKLWSSIVCEDEYINIDITSLATYSEKISMAEYGHQKQKNSKNTKQVNLCLLFGQKTFTPVYYSLYNGSLHDSKTLFFTVSRFSSIVGNKKCLFVMDRGFYSNSNLAGLNNGGHKYLCSVPFTNSWSKKLIDQYRRKVVDPINTIFVSDKKKVIVGMNICTDISEINRNINVHIFFNRNTFMDEISKISSKIAYINKLIIDAEDVTEHEDFIQEYFIIEYNKSRTKVINIESNKHSFSRLLRYAGWFIFVSNEINEPQQAYDIYYNKDMVEKGFFKFKHVLNLNRLEIHSDLRASNKVLIIFLSLILDRYVSAAVKHDRILKHYNLDKILKTMETIRSCYDSNGDVLFSPLTKEQNNIFKFFNIEPPVVNSKWDKYNF